MTTIGVIEWASDAAEPPHLLLAASPEALLPMLIEHFRTTIGDDMDMTDAPDFSAEHPWPDLTDTPSCAQWLADMREESTAPWVEIYNGANLGVAEHLSITDLVEGFGAETSRMCMYKDERPDGIHYCESNKNHKGDHSFRTEPGWHAASPIHTDNKNGADDG